MNKKAIFLDVDGTLVAGHLKMSDKVKEAIIQARKNGHKVFICTGRNKAGIKDELAALQFDGIVSSAGSYVEIDNQIVFCEFFESELVNKISKLFDQDDVYYNYECTEITFMKEEMIELFIQTMNVEPGTLEYQKIKKEHYAKYNVSNIEKYHDQSVHKICFIATSQDKLTKTINELKDDVNVIIQSKNNTGIILGELISKVNNKATGIQKAINYLKIEQKDTIAFGDSMNDYEMIDYVACGIVMENGSEELKRIATHVCKSVYEDGIYYEFKRLGLI